MSFTCPSVAATLATAVYQPTMTNGTVGPVDAATRRCIDATASATRRLFRFAIATWERAFNRIVVRPYTLFEKHFIVTRAMDHNNRLQAAMAAQLAARCSPTTLFNTYQRTISTFLGTTKQQAECVASALYIQDATLCLPR